MCLQNRALTESFRVVAMEGTLAVAGMSFSNVSHQIDNILSKQQLHHTTTTDEVTTYRVQEQTRPSTSVVMAWRDYLGLAREV